MKDNNDDFEIIEEEEVPPFLKKKKKPKTVVERAFFEVELPPQQEEEVVEEEESVPEFKPIAAPVASNYNVPVLQKKKKIPLWLIIGGIVLLILIIAVVCLFIFAGNKEEPEPEEPVVEEVIEIMPLVYKATREEDVVNYLDINNFSIEIKENLKKVGYEFEIVDNRAYITTNDGLYRFVMVQLSDKPYVHFLTEENKEEYEALVHDIIMKYGGRVDVHATEEMQAFFTKYEINPKANFLAFSTQEKIDLIGEAFDLFVMTLADNEAVCSFADCTTVLYRLQVNNEVLRIRLFTRGDDPNIEEKYYGTFLIFEVYGSTAPDYYLNLREQ